jgi:hypothetical protein
VGEADVQTAVGLAGYRLQAPIGRGGTGTVYRATQLSLERDVALKVLAADLAADPDVRERFLRESMMAASLEHPNIVPIYDAGEIDGTCYIAMRYIPGSDLQSMISRERRLSPGTSVSILEQIAAALQAAHEAGLIHRDVKPSNVLVSQDRGQTRSLHCWLGDFGLSKRAGETTISPTERPLGTVHYMAPEQIRGQRLDSRADIYSLGCLLYQCLTGRVPFGRESDVAVLYAHLEAAPPRAGDQLPDLPSALDDVISAALAKSPDERPPTVIELARAATAALTERRPQARGVTDPPVALPEPRRRPERRRRRRIVGRLAESQQLVGALDDALDGQGSVAFITGDAGIGKTTLARGLIEHAEQHGIPAVWSVGLSAEAAPAYWHWSQVLRAIATWPDASELMRSLGGRVGWLALIAPDLELAAPLPAEAKDVDEGRFHLYDALLALLETAAERSALLIVLDDLHAADEASLLALSFIAQSIDDKRILIVGAQRDVASRPTAAAIPQPSELLRPARTIALQGLEPDDVSRLIEIRNSVVPSPAAVGRIHRVTAGNPLFVAELSSLLDADQLRDERAIATRALPLPAGVRDAITARLGPMSQTAREVLEVAAVIGERFRLTTVAGAMSVDSVQVLDVLDQAVGLRLVRSLDDPPDGYAFAHGLIQATLYETLPTGRRAELHAAVGDTLRRGYDVAAGEGLAEIAHHLLHAAPVKDPRQAVSFARRAGDRAMERFAYEQAAALYARALATGAFDERQRIELMQSLGEAQTRAGDTDGARATLTAAAELAQAHDDAEALTRATLALGIWGLTPGFDRELVRLAELSVQRLQEADNPSLLARAKGFLAAALHWSGQLERRRRLSDEALALARSEHARRADRGSARTLAYVLGRYLLARWGPDSGREDFAISDELLALTQELEHTELELLTRNWRVSVMLELGRFALVDAEIARVEQMANELRQPRAMVFLPLHRAIRAAGAGRLEEAERLNAESAAIASRVRGSVVELAGAAQLVMLRLQQGRLAELEPLLRAMASSHPEMVGFGSALVAALLQAGRMDEAREQLAFLTARGLDGFPVDSSHVIMLVLVAEVAAELGDRTRAGELYEWLAPYSGRWAVSPAAFALWPVDRSLGRLATVAGWPERALERIADARRQSQSARALPSVALTALDEARALRARGLPEDRSRVATLAREARELAQRIGMGLVVDQATLLEAELGEGVADRPWEMTR